jgi:hypothetical protein
MAAPPGFGRMTTAHVRMIGLGTPWPQGSHEVPVTAAWRTCRPRRPRPVAAPMGSPHASRLEQLPPFCRHAAARLRCPHSGRTQVAPPGAPGRLGWRREGGVGKGVRSKEARIAAARPAAPGLCLSGRVRDCPPSGVRHNNSNCLNTIGRRGGLHTPTCRAAPGGGADSQAREAAHPACLQTIEFRRSIETRGAGPPASPIHPA